MAHLAAERIVKTSANDKLVWFTGTYNYYKHFGKFVITDGVKYLAERYQCFWLLDVIFSHQISKKVSSEQFQTWELERKFVGEKPTNKFVVTGDDGNKNTLVRQEIPFSDFEDDKVRLFLIDNVLLLPSEY